MVQKTSDPKFADGREQRQHSGHVMPRLTLRFEDHKYKTTDWSIGGFQIGRFHRPVRVGETLEGSVVTWRGLKHEAFKADVLRLGSEGDVSCRFLTVTRAIVNAMQRV